MDLILPAIALAFIGLPVTVQVLTALWAARARARAWQEAARAADLTSVEESRGSLEGWGAGSLRVRLSSYGSGTRITVSGPSLPSDLTVRPEGALSLLQAVRGVREIEIGHDAFDSAAWIEGSPAVVRAVLDADTRRALRALFDGRLERPRLSPFWATARIEAGVLRVDVPEEPPRAAGKGAPPEGWAVESPYVGGHNRLADVLQAVLALARRLETPGDVPRRLAENLAKEPVTGVRKLLITTLAREFPNHAATREALRAALADPDAEVRLRAAIALGPEGRDVLLAVARGEGAEDATTAQAVAALGAHITLAEAQGLLHDALRTRRPATARACVEVLGRRGGEAAVPTLAKVLLVERGELTWAAARALAMTRSAVAEAPLLRALATGPRDLRLVAATALGHVGTTASVAPLRETERGDSEMRRLARQAIAEIHSRRKGAAPGQLSLAGGESGQLSLASDESGRLSLTSGDRDRLPTAGKDEDQSTG